MRARPEFVIVFHEEPVSAKRLAGFFVSFLLSRGFIYIPVFTFQETVCWLSTPKTARVGDVDSSRIGRDFVGWSVLCTYRVLLPKKGVRCVQTSHRLFSLSRNYEKKMLGGEGVVCAGRYCHDWQFRTHCTCKGRSASQPTTPLSFLYCFFLRFLLMNEKPT